MMVLIASGGSVHTLAPGDSLAYQDATSPSGELGMALYLVQRDGFSQALVHLLPEQLEAFKGALKGKLHQGGKREGAMVLDLEQVLQGEGPAVKPKKPGKEGRVED